MQTQTDIYILNLIHSGVNWTYAENRFRNPKEYFTWPAVILMYDYWILPLNEHLNVMREQKERHASKD